MKTNAYKAFACLCFLFLSNRAAAAPDTPAARNKALVLAAMDAIMVQRDATQVDAYFAEPFIEHAQGAQSGLANLKALVETLAHNPAFGYQASRAIAQDDWVAVHGRYVGWAAQPAVAIDLFRLADGKIVEHRDGLGIESGPNPSGHTMLDGATQSAVPERETEANRSLVRRFVTDILIDGNAAHLASYFENGAYIQHNPHIADGVGGLLAYLGALAEAGISLRYTHIRQVMADGAFVLVESDGEFAGRRHVFFDIFRVENGHLAEHWDVSPAWDPPSN